MEDNFIEPEITPKERETFVHRTAEVSPKSQIGRGTLIWNNAQVRENVIIGRNCVIGKDVYIDVGVQIGNNVKIQNGVSIYKGVTLEDEVFVGPYSTFTNDFRPRANSPSWDVIPTRLRRGCSVGANATIICGVTLGEFCMIAAGTTVTSDTLPYGLYIGSPARLKSFVGKSGYEMKLTDFGSNALVYECQRTGEKMKITFET